MEKMLRENTKVISNNKIKNNYFEIILGYSRIGDLAKPGHFLEIKVSQGPDPFLRRPFSINMIRGKCIKILYEVVGQATEILSQKKPDEYLDVIGPLGNGFTYNLQPTTYNLPALVAGGMGVAPLLFLAEKLANSPQSTVQSHPLVLVGAKTKNQILCEKEFKKLGCDVKIATDDGSRGFKGKATGLLKHLLLTIDYRPSTIYACGPRLMLKEISRISQRHNISAQISLEEHMACGIGACLGCAVKTKDGFKRACQDGPIFNADEIIW